MNYVFHELLVIVYIDIFIYVDSAYKSVNCVLFYRSFMIYGQTIDLKQPSKSRLMSEAISKRDFKSSLLMSLHYIVTDVITRALIQSFTWKNPTFLTSLVLCKSVMFPYQKGFLVETL